MMTRRCAPLITAGLASLFGASAAMAQQSEPAAVASPPPASVQEVVVTAQRRTERLEDVPASITAISAATLAKSGITSTSDLSRVTPGLTMPFYGAFLQPSIRGVSSTGANIGDNANVALYLDGVYQPQQIAALIDLPDVQQVEVLKGPQGTLYGQNATGGAILVNTLTPSFKRSGFASFSYGDYNDLSFRGYVTGPITDQLAFSLSGGHESHDGYRTQIITGQHDRGLNSDVIRAKVLYEPINKVKLTLTSYYTDRFDSSLYAGVPINGNSVGYAFFPNAPVPTDPKYFATNPNVYTDIQSYGHDLRGEIDLGIGTLTALTSYENNHVRYLADVDFSPVNYALATAKLDAHYFIEEDNFASRKFFGLSFLAGFFYLNGAETFDPSGFELSLTPNLPPAPEPVYAYSINEFGRLDKEVYAGYAEGSYQLGKFVLTLGGRYSHEQQRAFSNTETDYVSIEEYPKDPVSFVKFTPRATLRYELTPESNVYGSYSVGFKSGLVNTVDFVDPPVRPEVIHAYEFGYKGHLLSNLTADVAAFYYDYTDLQVVAYEPPNYIEQNAASAHIKGIDVDAVWAVTPEFTLSGGMTFLDAHYASFPDAQIFTPTGYGGNNAVTADLSGRQLLRSPKESGNLTGDYRLPTQFGRFDAYASLYYNSGFGFEVSDRLKQGAYLTLDGNLAFEPDALQGLRLVLWGKNLTNAAYYDSVLASQLADGGSYAAPRTFGVRAEYRF